MNKQLCLPTHQTSAVADYPQRPPPPVDAQGVRFPWVLSDAQAIARYVSGVSSGNVDEERIEECFTGSRAILTITSIPSISEGRADGNIRSVTKERRYLKMNQLTMPPILIEGGVVQDGNHRLRVAIKRGQSHIWAYVVREA